ncbi:MAG: PIN-like domain-containing protein [Alkaliphilus sp.]
MNLILDTNILLELYKVSQYACNGLIKKLEGVIDLIWLPNQVLDEFDENYQHVQSKMEKDFDELSKKLGNTIDSFNKGSRNDIRSVIGELKRYSYKEEDIEELNKFRKEFEAELDKIVEFGNRFKINLKTVQTNDMMDIQKNAVIGFVKKFDYGEKITLERQLQIIKEGELRFKYHIPPGFKDEEYKDDIAGLKKFGDLLLWKEILQCASKKENSHVIFITNDSKEDWKIKKNGEKYRLELYREFKDYCPEKEIHFIDLSQFYSLSEQVDNRIKLEIDAETYVTNELFIQIQEEVIDELYNYFIQYDFTNVHDDFYRNNNGEAEQLDDLQLSEVKVIIDESEIKYVLSVSLPMILVISYKDNEGMEFSLGDINADVVAKVIVTFDLKDSKRVSNSRWIEYEDIELLNIHSRDLHDVYADDKETAYAERMEALEEYHKH